MSEDADGDVQVAVSVQVGGLGTRHAPHVLQQFDRLELEAAVVAEQDDAADQAVGGTKDTDVRNHEVLVGVPVHVGGVDPDGLSQPLAELHHVVQAAEPRHAPGQGLGSEYLETAVPVQVLDANVGGRVRLAIGKEHGV